MTQPPRRSIQIECDKPFKTMDELFRMMCGALSGRAFGRESFRHRCTADLLTEAGALAFAAWVTGVIESPEQKLGARIAGIVSGDPQEMFVLTNGRLVQLVLQDAGHEHPAWWLQEGAFE